MLLAGFLLALAGFALVVPRGGVAGASQTNVKMYGTFMSSRGYNQDDRPGAWKVRVFGLVLLVTGIILVAIGM